MRLLYNVNVVAYTMVKGRKGSIGKESRRRARNSRVRVGACGGLSRLVVRGCVQALNANHDEPSVRWLFACFRF